MIPLIEYNKPTITGRIYQKGCFTNLDKVKDFFIIEKPKGEFEDNSLASLNNSIFIAKLEENDFGLFIKDLQFVETNENKEFLSLFNNKKLGISSRSIGVVTNNFVEHSEIFGANLVLNYKEANSNHDFTFEDNELKLILEFLSLDRYGDEYVNETIFISPGVPTREND